MWRGAVARSSYTKKKYAAVVIQAATRGWFARKQFAAMVADAEEARALKEQLLAMQQKSKDQAAAAAFEEQAQAQSRAATTVQSVWRGYSARINYKLVRGATIVLQAATRGWSVRKQVAVLRIAANEAQDAIAEEEAAAAAAVPNAQKEAAVRERAAESAAAAATFDADLARKLKEAENKAAAGAAAAMAQALAEALAKKVQLAAERKVADEVCLAQEASNAAEKSQLATYTAAQSMLQMAMQVEDDAKAATGTKVAADPTVDVAAEVASAKCTASTIDPVSDVSADDVAQKNVAPIKRQGSIEAILITKTSKKGSVKALIKRLSDASFLPAPLAPLAASGQGAGEEEKLGTNVHAAPSTPADVGVSVRSRAACFESQGGSGSGGGGQQPALATATVPKWKVELSRARASRSQASASSTAPSPAPSTAVPAWRLELQRARAARSEPRSRKQRTSRRPSNTEPLWRAELNLQRQTKASAAAVISRHDAKENVGSDLSSTSQVSEESFPTANVSTPLPPPAVAVPGTTTSGLPSTQPLPSKKTGTKPPPPPRSSAIFGLLVRSSSKGNVQINTVASSVPSTKSTDCSPTKPNKTAPSPDKPTSTDGLSAVPVLELSNAKTPTRAKTRRSLSSRKSLLPVQDSDADNAGATPNWKRAALSARRRNRFKMNAKIDGLR